MRRIAACLLALSAASAFAADPGVPAAVSAEPIGRWMQPSWAPVSPQARIFLVAGARDIANFAQEVIDQKKYWLDRGHAAEHIECFWAVPDPSHRVDVEQFLALEEELRACHLATPKAVLGAIHDVARDYSADFFYLYVTSHGSYPPLQWNEAIQKQLDPSGSWLPAAFAEARADAGSGAAGWLAPYRIEMEGIMRDQGGGWGWIAFLQRFVVLQRRDGARAEDHLFTPALLAAALRELPSSVHKVVVLQGCHSGGFLLPAAEAPAPDQTLIALEQVTVLTAARADRTSFGCAGGDRTTFYGGSFQQVLDELPRGRNARVNWRQVHRRVEKAVRRLEREKSIPEQQQSLPQFFSNR